jgi:hypothetical protein
MRMTPDRAFRPETVTSGAEIITVRLRNAALQPGLAIAGLQKLQPMDV